MHDTTKLSRRIFSGTNTCCDDPHVSVTGFDAERSYLPLRASIATRAGKRRSPDHKLALQSRSPRCSSSRCRCCDKGRNEASPSGTGRPPGTLRIPRSRDDRTEWRVHCNLCPARTARIAHGRRMSEPLANKRLRRDTCRRSDPMLRRFDRRDNPRRSRIECTDGERSRNAETPVRNRHRSRTRRRHARPCRNEARRAGNRRPWSSRAASFLPARPLVRRRRTRWARCIRPRRARTARGGSAELCSLSTAPRADASHATMVVPRGAFYQALMGDRANARVRRSPEPRRSSSPEENSNPQTTHSASGPQQKRRGLS